MVAIDYLNRAEPKMPSTHLTPDEDDPEPPTQSHLILDTLPIEIQDLIFHYIILDSTPEELKLFRQSNRYFRDRADIHLFRTLHISASTASLERVRLVSEVDRINVHVRELVFHRGTFFGHKMARAARSFEFRARDYDDFETYVVRSNRANGVGPPVGMMRISECYDNFNQELEYESRFNQDMRWRQTLRGPCSRFTKLEKLTTLASEYDLESRYLRRRCALTHQSWTPNYFAPYEIFEPCGRAFRPKALSMDSVNGEDFASVISNIRGGDVAVAEKFSELRSLRLSFSETVSMLDVEGTWDVFIRSCGNLERLSLDFTTFYSPKMLREPDSFPQKVIKLFLQQTYINIKHLDLTYALMTEDDFISFLHRHQTSLTTLNLCRWPIPADASTGQPTGSIIRTFWKIGRLHMRSLRSVHINGEFSNRADGEGWTTCPWFPAIEKALSPGHETPIREQLEVYMSSGSQNRGNIGEPPIFPIPIDEKTMIDAKSGEDLLSLDELPCRLFYGDESFEWWRGNWFPS